MEPLHPDIAGFAVRYLLSLEDLKVLMLCVDECERWCDASAVARKLGIPRGTARRTLDHLARSNLLDIRISGDIRYRFRPGTPDLEAQAITVVEAYRKDPLQILQLIGGEAGRSARDLANVTKNTQS